MAFFVIVSCQLENNTQLFVFQKKISNIYIKHTLVIPVFYQFEERKTAIIFISILIYYMKIQKKSHQ